MISRNYEFRRQPGKSVEPTVENIARVIDYSTRLPKTLPVLTWFVNTHPWYEPKQVRKQRNGAEASYADAFLDWLGGDSNPFASNHVRLADDIERLRHGVRQIELAYEALPTTSQKTIPCGAAWAAAANLCKLFEFSQRWRLRWSERNLALLIDTSANLFRIEEGMNRLLSESGWLDKTDLHKNIELTRRAMQLLEIVRNSLPIEKKSSCYTILTVQNDSAKQRFSERELSDLKTKLNQAATPAEEQKTLTEWRHHVND